MKLSCQTAQIGGEEIFFFFFFFNQEETSLPRLTFWHQTGHIFVLSFYHRDTASTLKQDNLAQVKLKMNPKSV